VGEKEPIPFAKQAKIIKIAFACFLFLNFKEKDI